LPHELLNKTQDAQVMKLL